MRFVAAGLIAMLGLVFCLSEPRAGDDKKPKYTIKEVMKKAHKDGLLKKVASGKADEDDRKDLLELYTALAMNTPPKGDAGDWKTRTATIVNAAKKAVADPKAARALVKATNCAGCHKLHK
jgi:mono/diheme cytochrome c family protein